MFKTKDLNHNVVVKFVPAFLPDARKPFNLKAVHQNELDIRGIARMAEIYGLGINPRVIENVMSSVLELMSHLAAEGYRIKTPLFNLRLRFPGEYDGSETSLAPEGLPEVRFQPTAELRNLLKETMKVVIDGVDQSEGQIAEVTDDATGLTDDVVTPGHLLTIRGYGLKVDAEEARKEQTGVFFVPTDGEAVKAAALAVNEPRTLKVLVPVNLPRGTAYRILVRTQSSARGSGNLLKDLREIQSNFSISA